MLSDKGHKERQSQVRGTEWQVVDGSIIDSQWSGQVEKENMGRSWEEGSKQKNYNALTGRVRQATVESSKTREVRRG